MGRMLLRQNKLGLPKGISVRACKPPAIFLFKKSPKIKKLFSLFARKREPLSLFWGSGDE